MNLELWDFRAFLFGALSGIVCVGGLYFGVRFLMMSNRDELKDNAPKRNKLKLLGSLVLVGQFLGAFGIVGYYMSQTQKQAVLPLAFGIVAAVFIGNVIFATMRK